MPEQEEKTQEDDSHANPNNWDGRERVRDTLPNGVPSPYDNDSDDVREQ